MTFLKKVINNFVWVFGNQAYRSFILFFRIAILTSFLSKEDFGVIAIANLFTGFVGLFQDMGFSVGLLHKQNISRKEYSTLYWFNLAVGLILTIILCALSYPISFFYKESVLMPVVVLLSFNVLFSSLGNQHRIVLQKYHKHRFIVVVDVIGLTFNFLMSWLLAYNGFGVFSIVYSMLFYSFFTNIVFAVWGIFIKKNISFFFKKSLLKPFFNIGMYQMGSRFLDYFVRQIDILFISSYFSKSDLGLYSLCKNFVLMIYNFTSPLINLVLTPILADLQNQTELINKKLKELLAVVSFFIMPLFFIPSFFSWEILYYIYGASYTEGALVLSFLLLAYSLFPFISIVASLVVAKGITKLSLKWSIFNAAITFVFYVIAVYLPIEIISFNLIGLSILLTFFYYLIVVKKITNLKYKNFIKYQSICFILFVMLFSYPYYYFYLRKPNFLNSVIIFIPIFSIYIFISYRFVKDISLLKSIKYTIRKTNG
jgi:teichuronic acid exporter